MNDALEPRIVAAFKGNAELMLASTKIAEQLGVPHTDVAKSMRWLISKGELVGAEVNSAAGARVDARLALAPGMTIAPKLDINKSNGAKQSPALPAVAKPAQRPAPAAAGERPPPNDATLATTAVDIEGYLARNPHRVVTLREVMAELKRGRSVAQLAVQHLVAEGRAVKVGSRGPGAGIALSSKAARTTRREWRADSVTSTPTLAKLASRAERAANPAERPAARSSPSLVVGFFSDGRLALVRGEERLMLERADTKVLLDFLRQISGGNEVAA